MAGDIIPALDISGGSGFGLLPFPRTDADIRRPSERSSWTPFLIERLMLGDRRGCGMAVWGRNSTGSGGV